VLVERDDRFAPFRRKFDALVERAQILERLVQTQGVAHRAETHVHFRLRFGGDDVGTRPARHDARVDRHTTRRVAHRMKSLNLSCDFKNRTRALLRVKPRVRGDSGHAHRVTARSLARGLRAPARRRRFEHEHLRRALRLRFHERASACAPHFFVARQKNADRMCRSQFERGARAQ
jgi:hypothetical protein